MSRKRDWCEVCRDTDPEITCTSGRCKHRYHFVCLAIPQKQISSIDRKTWLCPECEENEKNDDHCYICRRHEDDDSLGENAVLLLCDGCTNSAHNVCCGLVDEPEGDWFCPACVKKQGGGKGKAAQAGGLVNRDRKDAAQRDDDKENAGDGEERKIGPDGLVINSRFCGVCQGPGKLIYCETCPRSYHAKCIKVKTLPEGVPWSCPKCQGFDPNKKGGFEQLTKAQRKRHLEQLIERVDKQMRIARKNRNVFLYESRKYIRPFVASKQFEKIKKYAEKMGLKKSEKEKKKAEAGKKGGRLKRRREENASDSESEDGSQADGGDSGEKVPHYWQSALRQQARLPEGDPMKKDLLTEGISLKHYQVKGVNWLIHSFMNKAGAILADEMGLGKTIQTLAFLSFLKIVRKIPGPHLIVVPLSTVGNWAREIRRFTPELSMVKICGTASERDFQLTSQEVLFGYFDVYITTYETVKTEEKFFADDIKWQCIILDEAHRIKNDRGSVRHSLDRVAGNMRVLLTGTPLQNNIRELFVLCNFLFPDILQDSDVFEQAFSVGKGPSKKENKGAKRGPKALKDAKEKEKEKESDDDDLDLQVDLTLIQKVSGLLSKLMMRRTKELVIKLPPKTIYDVWLPLTPSAAKWYKLLLSLTEKAGKTMQDLNLRKLMGVIVKLRLCCSHPRAIVSRSHVEQQLRQLFLERLDVEGIEEREKRQDAMEHFEMNAAALKEQKGAAHVESSAKLVFLDKLLCQLDRQNREYVEGFARADDRRREEMERAAARAAAMKRRDEEREREKKEREKERAEKKKASRKKGGKGKKAKEDEDLSGDEDGEEDEDMGVGGEASKEDEKKEKGGEGGEGEADPREEGALGTGFPKADSDPSPCADPDFLKQTIYPHFIADREATDEPVEIIPMDALMGGEEDDALLGMETDEEEKKERSRKKRQEAQERRKEEARKLEEERKAAAVKKKDNRDDREARARKRAEQQAREEEAAVAKALEASLKGDDQNGKKKGGKGKEKEKEEKKAESKDSEEEEIRPPSNKKSRPGRKVLFEDSDEEAAPPPVPTSNRPSPSNSKKSAEEAPNNEMPNGASSSSSSSSAPTDEKQTTPGDSVKAAGAPAAAAAEGGKPPASGAEAAKTAFQDGLCGKDSFVTMEVEVPVTPMSGLPSPAPAKPVVLEKENPNPEALASLPRVKAEVGAVKAEEQTGVVVKTEVGDGLAELAKQPLTPSGGRDAEAERDKENSGISGSSANVVNGNGPLQESSSSSCSSSPDRKGVKVQTKEEGEEKDVEMEDHSEGTSLVVAEKPAEAEGEGGEAAPMELEVAPPSSEQEAPVEAAAAAAALPAPAAAAAAAAAETTEIEVKEGVVAEGAPKEGEAPEETQTAPRASMHKVLIFTQFQLVLDELEEYCKWRGWSYMRLDGSTNKIVRELDIRDFNNPSLNFFVYLISTRAGGLGINLFSANHVVMFDEDWNPFVDLQAVDRAHRIGQKREVSVYKLQTEWTVEERMAFRREQKLKLDKMVVRTDNNTEGAAAEKQQLLEEDLQDEKLSAQEIKMLIRHGASVIKRSEGDDVSGWVLEDFIQRQHRKMPTEKELEDMPEKGHAGGLLMKTPGHIRQQQEAEEPEVKREGEGGEAKPDDVQMEDAAEGEGEAPRSSENGDGEAEGGEAVGISTGDAMQEVEGGDAEDDNESSPPDKGEQKDRAQQASSSSSSSSAVTQLAGLNVPAGLALDNLVLGKRERTKNQIFQPEDFRKDETEKKKLRHERSCFVCNEGGDELICCDRCPKPYHLECVGLEKVPKGSWFCPWHSCCECDRRASNVGGHLLHCRECPTSYCFDCFPGDFARVHPPVSWFLRLQRMGWDVNNHKMILFLCNDCRAFQESQQRRKMKRTEVEEERRKQREQQDALKAQMAVHKDEKEKEKQAKKEMEDITKKHREKEREIDMRIRKAFAQALPPGLVAKYIEKDKQHAEMSQTKDKKEAGEETADGDKEKGEGAVEGAGEEAAAAVAAKRKGPLPKNLRKPIPPEQWFSCCKNCRLPAHKEDMCLCPPERIKEDAFIKPKETESASGAADSTAAGSGNSGDASVASSSSSSSSSSSASGSASAATLVAGGDGEGGDAGGSKQEAGEKEAKRKKPEKKPAVRNVCPNCKASAHSRTECPKMTESDRAFLGRKREAQEAIIAHLENRPKLEPKDYAPASAFGLFLSDPDWHRYDEHKNHATRKLENEIRDILVAKQLVKRPQAFFAPLGVKPKPLFPPAGGKEGKTLSQIASSSSASADGAAKSWSAILDGKGKQGKERSGKNKGEKSKKKTGKKEKDKEKERRGSVEELIEVDDSSVAPSAKKKRPPRTEEQKERERERKKAKREEKIDGEPLSQRLSTAKKKTKTQTTSESLTAEEGGRKTLDRRGSSASSTSKKAKKVRKSSDSHKHKHHSSHHHHSHKRKSHQKDKDKDKDRDVSRESSNAGAASSSSSSSSSASHSASKSKPRKADEKDHEKKQKTIDSFFNKKPSATAPVPDPPVAPPPAEEGGEEDEVMRDASPLPDSSSSASPSASAVAVPVPFPPSGEQEKEEEAEGGKEILQAEDMEAPLF
uniref:Uncharacterized protein n=1 Tax=Chromera velia CCMP2878 TaxID=1169474 RepID=A0A0G4GMP0_9ALVE|eukprot:Cvel_22579.t1-p1 / transcript=Cvel_22579.t1 / gene=Cvel_22579 / organism=Chromera_velia_CCMP2878 / gene_product=ISWI chromatin-remodeling complex ATPase ISW2, putative / transcript_product=ISWI chromatin-remodeling complex ATPase ISW2, putative / location=Cvel_scaffold2232:5502-23891(-) / protein_length=2582 / sequence_SO=supercontig / SO=protein_coding / is_pseudo=false